MASVIREHGNWTEYRTRFPGFAGGSEAAYYKLQDGSPGKSMPQANIEVGAWGISARQIGCDFGP